MKLFKADILEQYNYLLVHVTTFFLLLLSLMTARETISDAIWLMLIGSSVLGFSFSWYASNRAGLQKWTAVLVDILGVAIVIYLAKDLFPISMPHLELVNFLIKILIAMEVLLSFVLFSPKKYDYMQLGTVIIVLCSVSIKRVFQHQLFLVLMLYILMYMLILRLRFLIEVKKDIKAFVGRASLLNRNIRNVGGVVVLFSVLFWLSAISFHYLYPRPLEPFPCGIFFSQLIGPAPLDELLRGEPMQYPKIHRDVKVSFYDVRLKLDQKLNELADREHLLLEQKKEILIFSLKILKEKASVQKALDETLRLEKFLMNPKLSLLYNEKIQINSLAYEYILCKIEYELEQLEEKIDKNLDATLLYPGQKQAILLLFSQLQNTNQYSIASDIIKQTYMKIEKEQSLFPSQKKSLKDIFNRLFLIKTNQTIIYIISNLREKTQKIYALEEDEKAGLDEMLSRIIMSRQVPLLKTQMRKIREYLNQLKIQNKLSRQQDEELAVRLETLYEAKTFEIAFSNLSPKEQEIIRPSEKQIEEEGEAAVIVKEGVIGSIGTQQSVSVAGGELKTVSLWKRILWLLYLSFFTIIVFLIVMWMRRYMFMRRLKKLMRANPRSFITSIYNNLINLFTFYGTGRRGSMPLGKYVSMVKKKYKSKGIDKFDIFTNRFNKVRFSSHIVTEEQDYACASEFNATVDCLMKLHRLRTNFMKYFRILIKKIPLKIHC